MLKPSLLPSAALCLVLTACAAPVPAPYQTPPRPQMDPLPADLRLTGLERTLCQRWLSMFSASPQTLADSCGNTSGSSSDTTSAAH